jgi:hypothetical protein
MTMSLAWRAADDYPIKHHGAELDFERFFSAHCEDVEVDADPEQLKTIQLRAEVARVWNDHARTLHRERM